MKSESVDCRQQNSESFCRAQAVKFDESGTIHHDSVIQPQLNLPGCQYRFELKELSNTDLVIKILR